jgi:hypothetical protein
MVCPNLFPVVITHAQVGITAEKVSMIALHKSTDIHGNLAVAPTFL